MKNTSFSYEPYSTKMLSHPYKQNRSFVHTRFCQFVTRTCIRLFFIERSMIHFAHRIVQRRVSKRNFRKHRLTKVNGRKWPHRDHANRRILESSGNSTHVDLDPESPDGVTIERPLTSAEDKRAEWFRNRIFSSKTSCT